MSRPMSGLVAANVAKRKSFGSKADANAIAVADDGKGASEEVVFADEHAEPRGKVARSKGLPRQSRQ
eukprot:1852644-Lingulodinium_polyedra.AAC.1